MTHHLPSRRELLKRGFKNGYRRGRGRQPWASGQDVGLCAKLSVKLQSPGFACFLFGGNDSNNLVIPISGQAASQYTTLRANLAVQNPLALGSTNYGPAPQHDGADEPL